MISQTSMSWKQKILFAILTSTLYITFIVVVALYYTVSIEVDIVAIYFVILVFAIPIGFVITGLYMYSVLKKARKDSNFLGFKVCCFILVP